MKHLGLGKRKMLVKQVVSPKKVAMASDIEYSHTFRTVRIRKSFDVPTLPCFWNRIRVTIGHRLRLNQYILYVFGQTRQPLAVSRAKFCPGSRPEVSSTPPI